MGPIKNNMLLWYYVLVLYYKDYVNDLRGNYMEEKRFAVLIDAENISSKYIKNILDEISNYGIATYKRIYADWTKSTVSAWKDVLLENSIIPVQQYSYTTGKNSTDSALIIDAMDMLYSKNVDGFCIVSSDSDFTRLAMRLRESGMMVIGMGEEKTPNPFVKSCHQFKFLDIISDDDSLSKNKKEVLNSSSIKTPSASVNNFHEDKSMTSIKIITNEILNIISDLQDNDNGINIGEIGQRLIKRYPDFDVRNYGYSKLSRFLNDINCLEIKNSNVLLKNDISDSKSKGLQISKNIKNDIVKLIQDNSNKALISFVHQKLLEKYPNYIKKYGYNKAINFYKSLDFISIKKNNNLFYLTIK